MSICPETSTMYLVPGTPEKGARAARMAVQGSPPSTPHRPQVWVRRGEGGGRRVLFLLEFACLWILSPAVTGVFRRVSRVLETCFGHFFVFTQRYLLIWMGAHCGPFRGQFEL